MIFLHPMNDRNQRAIGYDISSEKIRQEAIEKSMQTKDPTISRKIILVQEKDEDIQNGFLMLVPLYKSDNATSEYG